MLASLPDASLTNHVIAPLINIAAAHWIKAHAPQHAEHLVYYLPPGPARDLLDPRTPQAIQAQEQALAEQLGEQRQRRSKGATTRSVHLGDDQQREPNLYDVLERIPPPTKGTLPGISAGQPAALPSR